MMHSDQNKQFLESELERRILYGLSCEWETALWVLDDNKRNAINKPTFRLSKMKKRLACYDPDKQEIRMSRKFVMNHPWEIVRDFLRHEIAHLYAWQFLNGKNETAHGPSFQKACSLFRTDPATATAYQSFDNLKNLSQNRCDDAVMVKISKLLALAESKNTHEAEAAMMKAHQLIARYNVELFKLHEKRNYHTRFVGKPALRHFRESYYLAGLLQGFYFVQGIWVPVFVVEKNKMGKVLEISGTRKNLEIAAYVHGFVEQFIDSQWKSYNRGKGFNRYRKTDFAIGIITGFRSRLESEQTNWKETDEYALIQKGDPHLYDYMAYRYPHTTKFCRKAKSQDHRVFNDGKKIGKEMVIHKGIHDNKNNAGKRFLTD